ncbi:MAG: glycoside hydrolase family 5 protein [Sphingomonadaceae bacterium]|nr:glycoside hydrolase family 5 protein [Sphingomonadaceae bacterium]
MRGLWRTGRGRVRPLRWALALLAAALALPAAAAPAGDAWTTAATLHRGINVLGYDPLWTDPARARFQPRHFKVIRDGGFDFVRVVLFAFPHLDAGNRLDDRWLATLDGVVGGARAAGLSVILDEHDFDVCSADPETCRPKLLAVWKQLAARYRQEPASVLFEPLNEPHARLDAVHWNALLVELIAAIRATNPTRTLVIGPTGWNSLDQLSMLALPTDDRGILVTVHDYEPFRFTHQGASWADGGVKELHGIPFTDADAARIGRDLDRVADWSKANGRPVLLGEFGAYDRSGTPLADRVRYTATVRRAAEARHLPWAYWQFDSDFVAYDMARDAWVEPIRQALTGQVR